MAKSEVRLFTLDEVNALIPRLEMTMGRMQQRGVELREALQKLQAESDRPLADAELSELLNQRPELRELVADLEALIAEIEACGGHFKGLDLGLVDFPAEIDGKIGLLCWQYGEKEVSHWHDFESGFAGRQPLRAASPRSYLQ